MIPIAILTIESEDDRAYMTLLYQRHRALMLKTAWEYTREQAYVEDITWQNDSNWFCVTTFGLSTDEALQVARSVRQIVK